MPSLRLALTDVQLDLPSQGRTWLPVGRKYRGYFCNSGAEDLLVDLSRKLKGSTMLARDLHRRLAELAYQPPEFATSGRRKVATAELQAVPTVTDRLTQKQLFEGTTTGRFDRWNQEYAPTEKDKRIVTATRRALLAAGEKLLADPDFVALLSPAEGLPGEAAPTPAAADTAAQLHEGREARSFQAALLAVRRATPMIRTVRKNGHGVLISADGQVLTNYRVVANGSEVLTGPVMVVFESESIKGRIVRSDQTRGVALIQLERIPQTPPLPIARNGIGVSETVYVVGGPLEATLAHTISEGVITAHRVLGGAKMRFYQTNAAVERDNPTGPAFNDRGEIVALVSAAWANRTPGVHYLIPIGDALRALGINP